MSRWTDNTKSPYQVLAVPEDADPETIKKSFRELALRWHPDRNPGKEAEASDKFHEISFAYEILSDPVRKARYDHDRVKLGKYGQQYEKDAAKPTESTPRFRSNDQGHSKHEGWMGYLNGRVVCAITDTGADGNFIACHMAISAWMKVRNFSKGATPGFMMANGKMIYPIGKARARWRFQKDPHRSFKLEFFVLKDCVFDVMLGAEFIYKNRLLSTKHLSTSLERPVGAVHIRRVKTCGMPRQRLNGIVKRAMHRSQADSCSALPDSAAEPNLVSYEYASRNGWLPYMQPSPPACRILQFVDGSIEETEGRIELYWIFGKHPVPLAEVTKVSPDGYNKHKNPRFPPQRRNAVGPGANSWIACDRTCYDYVGPVAFDVLRNCPWDMIVGHVFLDQTDAFVSKAHCFTAFNDETPLSLNPIVWAKSKKKKEPKNDEQHTTHPTSMPPSVPVTDRSLHDALEDLALHHNQETKARRKQRFVRTVSGLCNSYTSSNNEVREDARLNQINVAPVSA